MALHPSMPRDEVVANLTAGAIVGVVAIPLSITLAVAVGVSPISGLNTAAFAGAVASIVGGSRFSITVRRRRSSHCSPTRCCSTGSRSFSCLA
ncbi:MAG: hypothetical protein FJ037_00830 [Chloroflexi bacterium]|nr:hypothetical protein [Chloroflexota bacterium]